jgi:hypothetical protein
MCAGATEPQSAGLSISQMTRCQAEVRPGRRCVTARYRSVLVCHSELTVQQQRLRPSREVAGGLDQSVGGAVPGVATTGRQYRLGRLRQGMADLLRRSPIGDLQTCRDLRPCDLGLGPHLLRRRRMPPSPGRSLGSCYIEACPTTSPDGLVTLNGSRCDTSNSEVIRPHHLDQVAMT